MTEMKSAKQMFDEKDCLICDERVVCSALKRHLIEIQDR